MSRFSQLKGKLLANYLINEHPQIIAFVLSQMSEEQFEEVIKVLPDGLASQIIERIYLMSGVKEEYAKKVISTLENDNKKEEYVEFYNTPLLKKVLNSNNNIKKRVGQSNPELYEKLLGEKAPPKEKSDTDSLSQSLSDFEKLL